MKRSLAKLNYSACQLTGLVFALLLLNFSEVVAQYRNANVQWKNTDGNNVEFLISAGFVRNQSQNIGDVVSLGTFYFGDGNSQSVNLTVSSVSADGSWYVASRKITHPYSSGGNFTAYFQECCRQGTVGSTGNYRLESKVQVGGSNEHSPMMMTLPIYPVEIDREVLEIPMYALDLDGDDLTFRLATSAESGIAAPAGLTIDSEGGMIKWATNGLTVGNQYPVAIYVEDEHGASVMSEFTLKIQAAYNYGSQIATSDLWFVKPEFDYSVSAPNFDFFDVAPGDVVSFTMKADNLSDNGQLVSLEVAGLPNGASFSPSSGSSASGTFSWTTQAADTGAYLMVFNAVQGDGNSWQSSVIVRVKDGPRFQTPHDDRPFGVSFITSEGFDFEYIDFIDPVAENIIRVNDVTNLSPGWQYTPPIEWGIEENPFRFTIKWTEPSNGFGKREPQVTMENTDGKLLHWSREFIRNRGPVVNTLVPSSATTGVEYVHTFQVTDSDLGNGDQLRIHEEQILPSWLAVEDNQDGTYTLRGTPTAADLGSHLVRVFFRDQYDGYRGAYASHTHVTGTINVVDVNCPLSVTAEITDVNCPDDLTGAIDVSVSGTSNPLTYSWSTGATTQDISGLNRGTYSVTVNDGVCSVSKDFDVVSLDNEAPTAVCTDLTVELDNNGVAAVTTAQLITSMQDNCGITSISLDRSNFSCDDLGINSVTISFEDASGNIAQYPINITVADTGNPTFISCPDDIFITVPSDSCELVVTWDPPQVGDNCSHVLSSTHEPGDTFAVGFERVIYTLSDGNGNEAFCSFIVSVKFSPIVSTVTTSDYNGYNVSCSGAQDGSIDVDIEGGCQPYEIWWEHDPDLSATSISGLGAGLYKINVTDGLGFNYSRYILLTEPEGGSISASYAVTSNYAGYNVRCADSEDGAVNVTVSGGTAPYSFAWNDGSTTEDRTDLPAGNSSVTISDNSGCSTDLNISLTSPSPIDYDLGPNQRSYYGYEPTRCILFNTYGAISGGVPGYSYEWNDGSYQYYKWSCPYGQDEIVTLKITDYNGCTLEDSVKVCATDIRCKYYPTNYYYDGVDMCYMHYYWNGYQWVISYETYCIPFAYINSYIVSPYWSLGSCGMNHACEWNNGAAPMPMELHELPEVFDEEGEMLEGENAGIGELIFEGYPNPMDDQARIVLTVPEDAKVSLKVLSSMGQLVDEVFEGDLEKESFNTFDLDISGWKSGIYFARLVIDGQPARSIRLVKR